MFCFKSSLAAAIFPGLSTPSPASFFLFNPARSKQVQMILTACRGQKGIHCSFFSEKGYPVLQTDESFRKFTIKKLTHCKTIQCAVLSVAVRNGVWPEHIEVLYDSFKEILPEM
jgi:hypothetical protein